MSAPLRWLTAFLLLACLALTSEIVTCLNSEVGGWATLLLLCTLPLAFASLHRAGQREFLVTLSVTLSLATLCYVVKSNAQWQLTITVERAEGVMTFEDGRRYVMHTADPARVPFHGINDAWAILAADDTPCTITWWNGTDREVVKAPLKAFFAERSMTGMGDALLVLLVLFLNMIPLLTWARTFAKGLPTAADLLRSREGLALTFLISVLAASVISPPSTWLSNEFLSRPDDWLCYEGGARAMLKGNLFLMPPPGGVELWSLLYTPLIALLHVLLGPATGALYIVQFATYLLLVPMAVRLVRSGDATLSFTVLIAALLFVGIDIDLHYAWRLLSDVAPLLLLTALFVAIQQRRDPKLIALLCGLLYLFRLEFIGMGALVFVFFLLDPQRVSQKERVHFLGIYFLCLLPYLLRWFLLYGNLRPFPVAMEESGHMPMDVMLTSQHITLKLRALFGDYAAINPDLRIRYHWFAVHVLFLACIAYAWTKHLFDRVSLFALACFGYVLATRMFSPSVGIYGHRHSLAPLLLEMIIIVLVIDASRSRQGTTVNS